MVLASLRISGRCVEMMSFNGYVIGGNYCSISTFIAYAKSLWAYTHVYLVACTTMRALLHAYLVGLEPLGLIFCLSLHLHAPHFFMCDQTQQLIRCVCEQRMPW